LSTVDLVIPIKKVDQYAFGYHLVRKVLNRKQPKISAWNVVAGAYCASKFKVKLVEQGAAIRFRGSLFKTVYGHNAIVSNAFKRHIQHGLLPFLLRVLNKQWPDVCIQWDHSRPIIVNRADVVRHYQCRANEEVTVVLSGIISQAIKAGIYSSVKGNLPWPTVVLSGVIPASTAKFYAKHPELQVRGHKIPSSVPNANRIVRAVTGHLRFEITLWRDALRKFGLQTLDQWSLKKVDAVFDQYLTKLKLRRSVALPPSPGLISRLPRGCIGTYLLWRSGSDVKQYLPPSTYARHKKELLTCGFDISKLPIRNYKSRIRLSRIFSTKRRVFVTTLGKKFWVPEK
jgi:hypothetical protein